MYKIKLLSYKAVTNKFLIYYYVILQFFLSHDFLQVVETTIIMFTDEIYKENKQTTNNAMVDST